MKVLMISSKASGGGAAIGAFRLASELNKKGIQTDLYVEYKQSDDSFINELPRKRLYKLYRFLNRVWVKILYKSKLFRTTNSILHSADLISDCNLKWINDSDYDIVHLHWVNGTVSLRDISRITKPIVWTMHDSWVCCGAEHHPNILENDARYIEGYYSNNKPNTTRGIDLCKKEWEKKQRYLLNRDIKFIAPSCWERDILKQSKLFSDSDCYVIPNILPFNVFFRRDTLVERNKRLIPKDRIVLGFGAAYNIDNPRSMKGTYYLIKALQKLADSEKYFLVIFGPAKDSFTSQLPCDYFSSGFVSSPDTMAELYSCCDIYICSSLIENLSYTIYEAISCCTPVVAFDVGGNRDLITHKGNGYLAKPYSIEDLVEGIKYCATNKQLLVNGCDRIKHDFSTDRIIEKHKKVYRYMLTNDNHPQNEWLG